MYVRHTMAAATVLVLLVATGPGAQPLEAQTRRAPGTSALDDYSERMKGYARPGTSTLDNDSMELRGRTADQEGTNSLDDGSLDAGAAPESFANPAFRSER